MKERLDGLCRRVPWFGRRARWPCPAFELPVPRFPGSVPVEATRAGEITARA